MARNYKDWINAYLDYTKFSESPDHFHFWTAVSTIAGALRGKVGLNMGYFEWTPNFFVFLVAPPGIASKSTSASLGMGMLREVPGVKFGPNSLTWQGLIASLMNSCEAYLVDPKDELGERIEMSAVTCSASELGTFLDPSNREMVDVLVDLWDGKKIPWTRFTKGEGEKKVINPWINLIACTTPSWIADNFTSSFIGGGFTSRCVFVFAEAKRQLVAYPQRHFPEDILERQQRLIEDLTEIAKLQGNYSLTEDAVTWGTKWYHDLYHNPPEIGDGDKFQGYIARKQTHVHKLAMVISAATRGDMKIDVPDLVRADKMLSETEKDMPRVFQNMNREQAVEYASDLTNVVLRGPIKREVLYRKHFFRRITYETFNKVLESAINAGMVGQLVKPGDPAIYIIPNEELLASRGIRPVIGAEVVHPGAPGRTAGSGSTGDD